MKFFIAFFRCHFISFQAHPPVYASCNTTPPLLSATHYNRIDIQIGIAAPCV
ncbi:unnamed protein product, partial [Ceratitis capitata]